MQILLTFELLFYDIRSNNLSIPHSLMKPALTWQGVLSNQELSTSALTRRACQSDATTFQQNKWIFFMQMPRTRFKVEEFRVASLSLVSLHHLLARLRTDLYPISMYIIFLQVANIYCFLSSLLVCWGFVFVGEM